MSNKSIKIKVNNRLTDEGRAKIVKLHKKGYRYKNIGDIVGVSSRTAWNVVKKFKEEHTAQVNKTIANLPKTTPTNDNRTNINDINDNNNIIYNNKYNNNINNNNIYNIYNNNNIISLIDKVLPKIIKAIDNKSKLKNSRILDLSNTAKSLQSIRSSIINDSKPREEQSKGNVLINIFGSVDNARKVLADIKAKRVIEA